MALPTPSRAPGSVGLLLLALVLIVGGGWWAHQVRTDEGRVTVREARFVDGEGRLMSADLYVPRSATAETPAPAVLAIHGYLNSKETQSPYAIEFARRGYVVLALDQTGHGYSDPPAFAAGYGAPAGLDHLIGLPMVNADQIVLAGHSMGGWAALVAAEEAPDAYASIVLSGSSTGTAGAPEGTPDFPRNLGLVYGLYEEFSQLMWEVPTGAAVVNSEKLQELFASDGPVQRERLYGSVEEGSGRILYQPATTHPGLHVTRVGIGPTIDWLQRTTSAPAPLPSDEQVWYWKELGTLLGFIGMVIAFFALGGLLLRTPAFAPLLRVPGPAVGAAGAGWWLAALLAAVVPAATYFWFLGRGEEWLPVGPWFPQQITNGIAVWAAANGAIALVLWLLWVLVAGRRGGPEGLGLGGGVVRALGLALATIGGGYLLVLFSTWAFGTDFRVWLVAAKPLSPLQGRIVLPYLVPLAFLFVALGLLLHGQLRSRDREPLGAAMFGNAVLMAVGFAGLLLIQYIPLLSGQPLPLGQPLYTILGFQFLVLLPIAGMLSTYFFHYTGRVWTGAFASALFVGWYLAASQATHYAF